MLLLLLLTSAEALEGRGTVTVTLTAEVIGVGNARDDALNATRARIVWAGPTDANRLWESAAR